jgi:class 3 adenylate cyclase/tetratricopeptide (TPR) repeat protein
VLAADQVTRHEARKHVTVLFIDLVDSTALAERLDPEPLRLIIDRYFAGCSAAIAAHGGVVEKFIGDAVMAAFGATLSHEDDAIRAVRAAADSLRALDGLAAELAASHQVSLAARCGICSGEVMVTTFPDGDFRVTGDAANTASRLQSAASPGAILIETRTAALVRGQVQLESIPPLRLKGKAQPVPAWQVTSPASPLADSAAPRAPLIGRDDELDQLARSFGRVTRHQRPCLATVLGAPGIGKTRLVREFLASLGEDDALVLSGGCSSYGAGITYQPLADMIGSYPGGWASLSRLMSEADHDPRAARSLASVLEADPGDESAAMTAVEEIAWATRHIIDVLSAARPVVLVWEDLHWAETTLLDLIEAVADWLIDVPVMLICVARTELLEARPSWGGGKPSALTLELTPLSYEQSATLVAELALTGDVYPQQLDDIYLRVAGQCDGNPLFAELMLDVLAEVAPGTRVPPTIQALLGARLDQLPGDERLVLEMAATTGREFSLEALRVMAATLGIDDATTSALLTRLAAKRMLQRVGRGGFRFAQSLLCDITYSFTPKSRRDQWHTLLANWFSARREHADATQQDALALAYHVEAACQLRRELLSAETGLEGLASVGADVLIAAGLDALARKDLPATMVLLERARGLLPPGDPRHLRLALRICDSGISLWDAPRCLAALDAAEAALAADPASLRTCAIQRGIVTLRLGLATPRDLAAETATTAVTLTPDDDLSWCRYHQLATYLDLIDDRMAAAETALRLGLERARRLRDNYEEERILCALCEVSQWAPSPVSTGLELCAELSGRFAANRVLLVPILLTQAYLTALTGALDDARELLAIAQKHTGDLHLDLADAAAVETSGLVQSLAGRYASAEAHYRRAAGMFRSAGQVRDALPLELAAARAMFDQGEEAAAARALAALTGEQAQMMPRVELAFTALRARLACAKGDEETATSLAREAWTRSTRVDDPCLAAEVLLDVSRVLAAVGQPGPAAEAHERAVAHLEAKGATLLADRAALPWPTAGDVHD